MKKNVLKIAAVSLALMFSAPMSAQSDLGGLLGNVLGAATGNS